jgi:Pectate lyase superfamily protein/Carboxypeptidase regulatory-like domain
MTRIVLCFLGLCLALPLPRLSASPTVSGEINLRDFGATGDGVADDGPAFQKALDALAAAGGGTLFVPEGKYAIKTPIVKDFTGFASSITIRGVESLTPLAPPTAPGSELSQGLDLLSEVYPRTGETRSAIAIIGLRNFVIKDIAFVGTPTVVTDAEVTVFMRDIEKAQIKHSEFYGLASLAPGGAIVEAIRSDLEITQCKFLGSTGTSGLYIPVVQNIEWRGITISDTTFIDYGQRPDFFSKSYLAAPISWINIGNAAQPTNHSPRREVILKNVFLDEGSYWGLSSLPYRYIPQSAPIDLIYVSGLVMNVSNFGQVGHELYDAQRVFIERSRYGWSHSAFAAIALRNVGTAIFDQLTCVADADHLYADENTRELTVINSTYAQLDSFAATTNTINTATEEDDPVQYVRRRFVAALGREPDAAAHFYWSNLLLHCFDNSACQANSKAALNDYLSKLPAATFAISGRITDEQSAPLAGVTVRLSGSQSVTTSTDSNGNYDFNRLPTSGDYSVTPSINDYIFDSAHHAFITPSGDRTANFRALQATHVIKGTIKAGLNPLPGVTVAISGSTIATTITDSAGEYSFALNTGGSYLLTPAKAHYIFGPGTSSISDLSTDLRVDFTATRAKHSISGRVLDTGDAPVSGVVMTLSGSVTGTITTASDGSYSFTNIDSGSSCTVTASKINYLMSPPGQTFDDLAADNIADFQATQLPLLLTVPASDRAVALELTQLIPEPFPLTTTLLSAGRNRTRIMLFGTNLGLLSGEGSEALTAVAEDAAHVRHPLAVEFVTPLPGFPDITQIVLRLNSDLNEAGDVLVSITVHGLTSNKARVAIHP